MRAMPGWAMKSTGRQQRQSTPVKRLRIRRSARVAKTSVVHQEGCARFVHGQAVKCSDLIVYSDARRNLRDRTVRKVHRSPKAEAVNPEPTH